MVGAAGLEPATLGSRCPRANQTAPRPDYLRIANFSKNQATRKRLSLSGAQKFLQTTQQRSLSQSLIVGLEVTEKIEFAKFILAVPSPLLQRARRVRMGYLERQFPKDRLCGFTVATSVPTRLGSPFR